MKYNIPFPDVRYRDRVYPSQLSYGVVVAFAYEDYDNKRTGIIMMDSPTSFIFAVNLYEEEGYIWHCDQMPDNICLYEANKEETAWALRYYFETNYACNKDDGKHPAIAFIEKECPHDLRYEGRSQSWFCKSVLAALPSWGHIGNDKETIGKIWKEALIGANQGVAFNADRAELYCYLIAVLMITQNVDKANRDFYISRLDESWDHFAWMYAMVIGRIIGCELKTFTSIVNALDNKKRCPYIRLYLPLVEENVDKICKYSVVEKRYKLLDAIKKIRKAQELHEQLEDLDDIYQILFPRHFRKMMSETLPASSIKEMRDELAKKDEEINRWKTEADNLSEQVNQLTEGMKARVENSLSIEDVSTAILAMSIDVAKMVFSNLDFKLRKNKVWRDGRDSLLDRLEEKELSKNGASVGTNNGIVAGGNLNANFHFTDEQIQMLIPLLGLNSEQSKKLLNYTSDGNNNTR